MNFSKPFGPAASETSEVDVEDAIGELSHEHAVIRQGENADGEMSVAQFTRLLHSISGGSKREIDALMGDYRRCARNWRPAAGGCKATLPNIPRSTER